MITTLVPDHLQQLEEKVFLALQRSLWSHTGWVLQPEPFLGPIIAAEIPSMSG